MNLILIRVDGGKLRLSVTLGNNGETRNAPMVNFIHPFDDDVLEEIRWYLEDYLKFPYGIEPQKADKVVRKMKMWGSALFKVVFGSSNAPVLYQEAVQEGLDKCEINVSSDDPKILMLPWELLYGPDHKYLSFSLAGMYRSLDNVSIRAQTKAPPENCLNILMVTARPFDERDVAYGAVVRPVLDSIKHLGTRAQLKLLRPPTFEALERELSKNKGKYHVVHFDGHGGYDDKIDKKYYQFDGPPGVLLFETLDGSSEVVLPKKVGQLLEGNGVPLFVINSCRSGAHGGDAFPSVASQLINTGANALVAMAYSAYGEAVRVFMGRFYDEIVAGRSVSQAVGLGRKSIQIHSDRPSPKGDMELEDWVVPVLYQQEKCVPFQLQGGSSSTNETPRALMNDEDTRSKLVEFPHQGRYGFIGREVDMLRLEKYYRKHQVVVLQGMGGIGKTELACGFARWSLDTNGRSQAFFTSFEHGTRLANVVNQVGRFYIGDKFSHYPTERRQRVVTEYLRKNECLLVLDNFESVSGHKSDTEGLLTEAERTELSGFLASIVGGKSWVLITSRGEEEWLGCQRSGLRLGGLEGKDITEFAKEVFAQADIDMKLLPSEYLDLLKMLNGHPLSVQVVLPRLKTETPREAMVGLENGLKKVDINGDERNKSLAASLKYSFDKLSLHVKQHLPFLCLLSGRVDTKILGCFSKGRFKVEDGDAYRKVFKDSLDGGEWVEVLGEAGSSGIVEKVGQRLFRLHPTLPWFLRQQLKNILAKKKKREVDTGDGFERLEMQFIRFYKLVAGYFGEKLDTEDADSAMTILTFEEPNLLRQLRRAEHVGDWDSAQFILQALHKFYKRRNRDSESVALRNRAQQSVGQTIEAAKSKGSDAHKFWMFLKNNEANDLVECGKLEEAENIYLELLKESTELNNQKWIAACHHQLGIIAAERRQWEKAKECYEKSMKIEEEIGDTQDAARNHHSIGCVADEQRKLAEAEKHYQAALKILEDAGDIHGPAMTIQNLGAVKQEMGKLEDAKQLFSKALGIYERVGAFRLAAKDYYRLGIVTRHLGRLPDAKEFYKKALKIYEDESLLEDAANTLHGLGQIAKEEGQLGEVIALWWRSWGNYMEGNRAHKARGYPGRDLASLLAEVGEDEFKDLWRESIEEECQDSFVEILKSIKAKSIDEWLRHLSDIELKKHSDSLSEVGEVEFKKWFAEEFKMECPQWHLEKLMLLMKEKESLPAAEGDQTEETPTGRKIGCLNSRCCVLQ